MLTGRSLQYNEVISGVFYFLNIVQFCHDSYPMLLTCQMHTDYTVSAHDILIFDKCSAVFVICTDNNQQLDSSKCGIQLIQTVIAQSVSNPGVLLCVDNSNCSLILRAFNSV